jgi:hypothetical protein
VDELRKLEEQLLQPEFRRNRQAVGSLLAPEFREFGSSGRIYTRQEILDLLESESRRQVELTDFQSIHVGPDVALVTYRTHNLSDSSVSLRSSVWIRREDRWLLLFHQGTPVPA